MNYSVLLVEDDDLARKIVKDSLLSEGFNVLLDTASVAEALEFSKRIRPQVALLDYNLGKGPNGLDLAKALRKSQPELGIIIYTAYSDPLALSHITSDLPKGVKLILKNDLVDFKVLVEALKSVLPQN